MNPLRSIGDFLTNMIPASHVSYTAGQPMPAATPAPTPPAQGGYNVRGMKLSDQDMQTLRNVLYAEISNRPVPKQQLEARTIINTALNRIPQYQAAGKQVTLHDVLTMPNQYQGYGSPQYRRITSNATTSIDAPKLKAIDSTIAQLKSGNFPDTTSGSVYYHHTPQGQIVLRPGTLFKQPKASRTMADLGI